MRIVDVIETGPDSGPVHIAAVVVEHIPQLAKHAVTLCGIGYHERDSWMRGRTDIEEVSCQQCRVNARILGWLK